MNYLTVEELKIVNESLQYTNNLYKNQSKVIEQSLKDKKINYLEYLKAQKSIIKKVDIIGNHYLEKVFNVLNWKNKSRKAHKESIPTYLEKSHQLVKKRQSNGYLLIAMFYILGMVVSISTTIFILFFS